MAIGRHGPKDRAKAETLARLPVTEIENRLVKAGERYSIIEQAGDGRRQEVIRGDR